MAGTVSGQLTCAHSLGEVLGLDILVSRGLAQLQSNTLAALGKGRGSAWLEVRASGPGHRGGSWGCVCVAATQQDAGRDQKRSICY